MSAEVPHLMKEIEALIGDIKNPSLREKVHKLFMDPTVLLKSDQLPLDECPGGSYVHHSYEGGLLQHTVSVTRLATLLCDLIEQVYQGSVDRDVVLAGAILHDVMKCHTYTTAGKRFMTSPLGERIDHLTLLTAEMYKQQFPLDVIHVVVAHHGDTGPLSPRTLEALVVYMADYSDAELSRRVLRAAESLVKRAGYDLKEGLSSQQAIAVLKAKQDDGWAGLRKVLFGETYRETKLTDSAK